MPKLMSLSADAVRMWVQSAAANQEGTGTWKFHWGLGSSVVVVCLLHVPLTTLRQPCNDIGAAALSTMVDRVANPGMSVRHVTLECTLIVRKSCGAPRPEE